MTREYRAFLLRCWRLTSGDERFEVAHVQTGASLRVETLADALDWIGDCLAAGRDPIDPPRAGDAPAEEVTKTEGGAKTRPPLR
jgi:hypothetical protein